MNAQMMADIIAGASTDADMENLMRNILQIGAAVPGTEDERACKQVVAILQQGRVNWGSNKDFKL